MTLPACKKSESSSEEAANPTAKRASTTPAGSTGKIAGKITFTGTAPEMPELPRFNADGKPKDPVCTTHEKAQYVQVKDGGVKDVVVRLAVGSVPKPSSMKVPQPAVIDQKDCMYDPHVLGLLAGQKLEFKNSDETLHNIHTYKGDQSDFNIAQPKDTPPKTTDVNMPAGDVPYRIRCDVHPWMEAFVLVSDNPYFTVTGADGSFELDNVPAGTYKLEAWHPYLGKKTIDVTVKGGEKVEATFPAYQAGDYKKPQ